MRQDKTQWDNIRQYQSISDKSRHGKTRQYETRQDKTTHDKPRQENQDNTRQENTI